MDKQEEAKMDGVKPYAVGAQRGCWHVQAF